MRALVSAAVAIVLFSGCVHNQDAPETVTDARNGADDTARAYARMDAGTGTSQLVRGGHCADVSILKRNGDDYVDPMGCFKGKP